MGGRNYKRGASYEQRRLDRVSQQPGFIKGSRHYASRGICDLWYIIQKDGQTTYVEEQCKYGTKNYGRISTEEFIELLNYAMDNEGKIKVYLTSKMSRKPELVWPLN